MGIRCISGVLFVSKEIVYSGSGIKLARVSLYASGCFVSFLKLHEQC